jgi:hypothetical protein
VPIRTYDSQVFRTNMINGVSSFSRGIDNQLPSSDLLSNIQFGMTSTEYSAVHADLAYCESGNCTFGTYQSLGVDYECITVDTTTTSDSYLHGSDSAFKLNREYGQINSTTLFEYPDSLGYSTVGPLITRWLLIANNETVDGTPFASECAFFWAVFNYNGEVVNNQFNETIVTRTTDTSDNDPIAHNVTITPSRCWINGTEVVSSSSPECTNTVTDGSYKSIQNYFKLTDFGLIGNAWNITKSGDEEISWDYSSIFMQTLLAYVVENNSSTIFDSVQQTANGIAEMMTHYFRIAPIFKGDSDNRYYAFSNGTSHWAPEAFYVISWVYVAIPAGIILLSLFFLAATVLVTRKDDVWKNSQLAVLFHGLSQQDTGRLGDVSYYADMREISKRTEVKLESSAVGKKLVGKEAAFDAAGGWAAK